MGCACAGNAGNVFPGHRGLAIPACIMARASRTCPDACQDRQLVVSFEIGGGKKRSRHSRRIRNPQFYVSGKRPIPCQIEHGATKIKVQYEQGKSEGFENCDRPIVRKRPIWVKIGDVLSRVTLKFDGWPWKTIGHLSFAVSSFVQHFIAIGEFKLELLSGIAQFGSNSTILRAVWPWNLTDDLEKQ